MKKARRTRYAARFFHGLASRSASYLRVES